MMSNEPPQGAHSADPVRELLNNLRDAATEAVNATAAANRPQPAPGERRYEVEAHGALTIAINAVESALRTALAAPEGPAPEPVASALMDNQGELINFHSRKRDFFGAMLDDDGYIHDRDDEARADKDAAGRAPHRATLLYAAAPEAPPPVEARQPEPEGQKLARMWLATHYTDEYDARDIEALCWKILGHDTAPDDLEAVAIIEGQPRAAPLADWQKRAIDIGFKYWRASDAHGVTGTPEQATTLLADLLGVEVEIAALAAPAGAIQPHLDHQVGAPVTPPAGSDSASGAPRATAMEFEDIPACPGCGAMAGCCNDYPNCPGGTP